MTAEGIQLLRNEIAHYRHLTPSNEIARYTSSNSTVRISRLDKHSDIVFDFQRQPCLIELAEHSLGMAVIPLKADCVYLNAIAQTIAFQESISHHGHFPNERAITLLLPLTEAEFSCRTYRPLHEPVRYLGERDHCVCDDISISRHYSAARVLTNNEITVFDPDEIIEVEHSHFVEDALLLLAFRTSSYRQQLSGRAR